MASVVFDKEYYKEPLITNINGIKVECDFDDGVRRFLNFKFEGGNIGEDGPSLTFDYAQKKALLMFNWDRFTLEAIEVKESDDA